MRVGDDRRRVTGRGSDVARGIELPEPADDGRAMREAGPWALDKLGTVKLYLPAFTQACKKAGAPNLVDGFAGPGINVIKSTGQLTWGTAMLGVGTVPPFGRCLTMDLDSENVDALSARAHNINDRAIVLQGDANAHLVPAMRANLDPGLPTVVVLDPQGPHLEWATVEQIAAFRTGRNKAEQLILLPTHIGMLRELPSDPEAAIAEWAERDFMRVFGNDRWHAILQERQNKRITTDEATTKYVQLYGRGLREQLDYAYVFEREVRWGGPHGQLMYFLVYATDHPAGGKIMDHCFNYSAFEPEQPALPGLEPPRRRRLDR